MSETTSRNDWDFYQDIDGKPIYTLPGPYTEGFLWRWVGSWEFGRLVWRPHHDAELRTAGAKTEEPHDDLLTAIEACEVANAEIVSGIESGWLRPAEVPHG